MDPECWTKRYSPARLPPTPLQLCPPLERRWKRDAAGPVIAGRLQLGDDAVFTTLGDSRATRLSLETGETVWDTYVGAGAMLRLGDELLACSNAVLRSLRMSDGVIRWERPHNLGLDDTFISDGVVVGALPECLQVVSLDNFEVLWTKPGLWGNCFAGTSEVVITWSLHGQGVACHDLRTGAVRWERSQSDVGEPYLLGCIWRDKFINILGHLKALDLATGRTLWEWEIPRAIHWWHPYDGRAYIFIAPGRYIIVDMETGQQVFHRDLGPHVPVPVQKRKGGVRVVSGSRQAPSWQYVRLSVSETHAFVANASGQILVLARDTGELEQVVEIDGMPVMMEPIIYKNHLLIHDFNAAIYCFKGAV